MIGGGFPARSGTLAEWQAALHPLKVRVRTALWQAGCVHGWQIPWHDWEQRRHDWEQQHHEERAGWRETCITPAWVGGLSARDYVEVIHFDTPEADHRTPCAQYAAALEAAGLRVEIEETPAWERDGVYYAPYPRVQVYADANRGVKP